MSWNNSLRKTPYEKLIQTKGWRERGVAYWEKRLAECERQVKDADSSTQLGRAIEQREMAQIAVIQIKEEQ